MNATSSRAHTVLIITFGQTEHSGGKPINEKKSKINLVDLAGSERAKTAGDDSIRQTEGSNINKSLSFLGKVINILADKAAGKKEAKNKVVPYRESKLTRMLQNALGGNSKTAIIAAISPADINYEESYSTLIYANQVKQIKNKATVNENKFIRELREENERLKRVIENKAPIREETVDYSDKALLVNLNDDPLLSGKIKHVIDDGIKSIGRPGKGHNPDISISGVGVAPEHNQISFDKGTEQMFIYPNSHNPKKNKTYVNGKLVTEDTQLQHGDRVLFGNHNYYVVQFPGQELPPDAMDYEQAMQEVLEDQMKQMGAIKDKDFQDDLAERYRKLKDDLDRERGILRSKLAPEHGDGEWINPNDQISGDLMNKIKNREDALKLKLLDDETSEERRRELEAQLGLQKDEAERLRKLQEEQERLFDDEKKRALRAMEEAFKKLQDEEFQFLMNPDLQICLARMIAMCNEANEMCQNLGRYHYNYRPCIKTEIMPDGSKMPVVICRAYPDREKDFYNEMNTLEFEDKLFMIREKWENFQYELDRGNDVAPELEIDQDEGYIFGLEVKDEWRLIGNVYIFMDSISHLLDTVKDQSPIIDSNGEIKGKLVYSFEPKVFDDNGEPMNLMLLDNINNLTGRNMSIQFNIHSCKEIPEKLSSQVFAQYQWIDEDGRFFQTVKSGIEKNKNPVWDYKLTHDLYYSGEELMKKTLTISVYGKYSPEDFKDLYDEYTMHAKRVDYLDTDRGSKVMMTERGGHRRDGSVVSGRNGSARGSRYEDEEGGNIYDATKKYILDPETMLTKEETLITAREKKKILEDAPEEAKSVFLNGSLEQETLDRRLNGQYQEMSQAEEQEARNLYNKLQQIKKENKKLEDQRSQMLSGKRSNCCSIF